MIIHKVEPKTGQESVWDYPRPPRLEDCSKHVKVVFNGVTIADTTHSKRVLETSHPPVYYIPPDAIKMQYLRRVPGASICEWKGQASYCSLSVHKVIAEKAGWFYPNPVPEFSSIKDYIAFYPERMDACYVDGELLKPQPGGFYGGWITRDIIGPFKGEHGTWGW